MTALLFGSAAGLLALAMRSRRVVPGAYLGDAPAPTVRHTRRTGALPAGVIWGAGAGVLAASTTPDQAVALVVLGTLAGALGARAAASTRRQRRSRRLVQELPTIADTLALHVLAGESVAGAIRRVGGACRGVAAEELAAAAAAPGGLEAGLRAAAASSSHPEGTRLYELLGHAHRTGGRLADSLGELATDYRASLTTELTAEGGRRALASYGPILAFMIPVTLLFLMYPTLAGLSALSATP
jgi:tight adherence protein C